MKEKRVRSTVNRRVEKTNLHMRLIFPYLAMTYVQSATIGKMEMK